MQQRPQIETREYASLKDARRDMERRTQDGWQVTSAPTQLERRRGCLARLMWLPWMANKKAHYLVTYTK